ncbi:protein mono-ADP-ribosyltransferase PARP15-like isoform X2 [Lagopus leucura]|uniref:protein mono-ADP-ribosyltransferase PARP15-like isoform X2 n=1 Tax=Lagopus leucura TaxID=30410 RepID=UPI001C66E609|nr:protein mono-ADP-ribosyltransferase PARP15-like isoform X2 [Lagopus leucura]
MAEIRRMQTDTGGVVIGVGGDLQLEKGQLVKALLRKTRPRLQADLNDKGLRKSPGEGSVFTTRGYSLSCSYVFHAVTPRWSEGSESAVKAFSNECERRCGSDVDEASEGTVFFGCISSPSQDVYEMTIGSMKFQVAAGDITKETGDVIVNIPNKTVNLQTGVSKAILEGAGKEVENECAELALQPNDGYITTKAGSLPCQK